MGVMDKILDDFYSNVPSGPSLIERVHAAQMDPILHPIMEKIAIETQSAQVIEQEYNAKAAASADEWLAGYAVGHRIATKHLVELFEWCWKRSGAK